MQIGRETCRCAPCTRHPGAADLDPAKTGGRTEGDDTGRTECPTRLPGRGRTADPGRDLTHAYPREKIPGSYLAFCFGWRAGTRPVAEGHADGPDRTPGV